MTPEPTWGPSASPQLSRVSASQPTMIEARLLAFGALAAAIVTVVVDSRAPLVVGLLVVALIPWTLLAADHRLPLWLFVTLNVVPAGAILVTHQAGAVIFLGILAVFWVGSVSGWRGALVTVVPVVALSMIHELFKEGGAQESGSPYFVIGIGIGAFAGVQSHRQRRLMAELEWSQDRLRRAAAADERARIAREIHDLLAHSLTVVVLNLSGARKALATHPDLADEALQRAEQTGRDSLDGMRRIVGLLRDANGATGAQTPDVGSPGVGDVEAIVAAHRAAGAEVTLTTTGELGSADPFTSSAIARVVTEALTNAGRHAPGAPVEVRISVDESSVDVIVDNMPGSRSGLDRASGRQGFGLVGMRERVGVLGGTFSAGPRTGGGWTVSCTIPMCQSPGSASSVARHR